MLRQMTPVFRNVLNFSRISGGKVGGIVLTYCNDLLITLSYPNQSSAKCVEYGQARTVTALVLLSVDYGQLIKLIIAAHRLLRRWHCSSVKRMATWPCCILL